MNEKVLNSVLKAFEEVLELDREELMEDPDLNLLEEGLLDSLTTVTLIRYIEKALGQPISINDMNPDDFTSVRAITNAIARSAE